MATLKHRIEKVESYLCDKKWIFFDASKESGQMKWNGKLEYKQSESFKSTQAECFLYDFQREHNQTTKENH